jgi:hypothetical protein
VDYQFGWLSSLLTVRLLSFRDADRQDILRGTELNIELVITFQALVLANHVLIDHFAEFSPGPSPGSGTEDGSQDCTQRATGSHENRYGCSTSVGAYYRTECSTNRGSGTSESIYYDDTTPVASRAAHAQTVPPW